jgi:hypothetical protein
VFTRQEQRRVTHNLTLHYKRVMYLLDPSPLSRRASGKQVLVREPHGGEVIIEFKGAPLPARAFVKDARIAQGAVADSKVLSAAFADIQSRQKERDAKTLTSKRLTLRDEDLVRKAMGDSGLPTRRRVGRPTIRELALARIAKEEHSAVLSGTGVTDAIVGQMLARLVSPAE